MRLLRNLLLGAMLVMAAYSANAQFAVKSNLLGWATTTTNLGIEFGARQHSTWQIMGYLNPWNFPDEKHFRSWTVQPEYRYWFSCSKFNGWFVGVHALGGQYVAKNINFPLKALTWGGSISNVNSEFPDADHKGGWPNLTGDNSGRHVEGWDIGGGVSIGYQWVLGKHWNLEASVGAGYVYSRMKYIGKCDKCIDRRKINYVGPTNAQLSFLYIF